MKKDESSNRSISYFQRNCLNFRQALEYVKKLLKFYEIEKYVIFEYENGTDALNITLNYADYIISFDTKNVCLKVTSSIDNHQRYTKFTDADCYHQVLKFIIKEDNKNE